MVKEILQQMFPVLRPNMGHPEAFDMMVRDVSRFFDGAFDAGLALVFVFSVLFLLFTVGVLVHRSFEKESRFSTTKGVLIGIFGFLLVCLYVTLGVACNAYVASVFVIAAVGVFYVKKKKPFILVYLSVVFMIIVNGMHNSNLGTYLVGIMASFVVILGEHRKKAKGHTESEVELKP